MSQRVVEQVVERLAESRDVHADRRGAGVKSKSSMPACSAAARWRATMSSEQVLRIRRLKPDEEMPVV